MATYFKVKKHILIYLLRVLAYILGALVFKALDDMRKGLFLDFWGSLMDLGLLAKLWSINGYSEQLFILFMIIKSLKD